MPVRSQLAAARVRSFAEAGEAYLQRVQDNTHIDGGASRARQLKRSVLRQLSTSDRRHLIYRFAHWFSLSRFAGVEPMDLCFDPPVFVRDAYRAFANASPGWITETHELREPSRSGHQVFLALVPELCCFGFIITEVLGTAMLRRLSVLTGHDSAACAVTLNAELTRSISALGSDTALSDHYSRVLFRLVEAFEEIVGADFSPGHLTDDQVLEGWKATADANDATRFIELLHQLSVLSIETRVSEAEAAAVNTISLDDPKTGERIGVSADRRGDAESIGQALSEPLIVELLARDEMKIAEYQLDRLAGLEGLDLSRARSITFAAVENRVIQAKRERRDARSIVCVSNPGVSHAASLALLQAIIGKLDRFIVVAAYLLWQHGRRGDALSVAVVAGRLRREEAMALAPNLRVVSGEDVKEGLEKALAAAAAEPVGPLGETLQAGREAWRDLRRRNAFAGLAADGPTMNRLDDAAMHACRLLHDLGKLRAGLGDAIGSRGEGEDFATEYDTFCAALAEVHGFEFTTRISR